MCKLNNSDINIWMGDTGNNIIATKWLAKLANEGKALEVGQLKIEEQSKSAKCQVSD